MSVEGAARSTHAMVRNKPIDINDLFHFVEFVRIAADRLLDHDAEEGVLLHQSPQDGGGFVPDINSCVGVDG